MDKALRLVGGVCLTVLILVLVVKYPAAFGITSNRYDADDSPCSEEGVSQHGTRIAQAEDYARRLYGRGYRKEILYRCLVERFPDLATRRELQRIR